MSFKAKRELKSIYRIVINQYSIVFIFHYLIHNIILRIINRKSLKRFDNKTSQFREELRMLDVDNDFFSGNIPTWLRSLEMLGISGNDKIEYLEIGSWQGVSSIFMLSQFQNLNATCVDTWEGSDEHKEDAFSRITKTLDSKFDKNVSLYKNRVIKAKQTSFEFFTSTGIKKYDVIYVDGSHHADDVLIDGLQAFKVLKKGGLLIFDDYTWKFYSNANENPTSAINAFLKLKKGMYRILDIHQQVHLQKIVD